MQLNTPSTFLALFLGELLRSGVSNRHGAERMLVDLNYRVSDAVLAEIDLASIAVMTVSSENINMAESAGGDELGCIGVMQVV